MENSNIKPVRYDKVRDYIIDLTVEKTKQSEDIVRSVIDFQWDTANEALKTKTHLELSGFCRFAISYNKLQTRLRSLEALKRGFIEAEEKKDENPKKYKRFLDRQTTIDDEYEFLCLRAEEKVERDKKRVEYAEKNREKILKNQKGRKCSQNLENS